MERQNLYGGGRKGLLKPSIIPKKEVEIYEFEKLEEKYYNNIELFEIIDNRISKLSEKSKKNF